MATLPPLVAELIAKTDGFQAGLARASQSAQEAAGGITGAFGKINAALGALGVTAAVAGFAAMIKGSIDLQDQLYKMSQSAGISVESLSTLRYGAELSGLSLEEFEAGLVKLNKKLAEAGAGSVEAAAYFKQFGISAAEIKSGAVDVEESIKRMAERFATSPDGINKSAASVEGFSKALGGKFVPLLNQGREGIEAMQIEARKLGLELSTETAKRAEEFNDQMAVLKFSSQGAAQAIAETMLPSLVKISQAMRDATVEGGKLAGIVAALSTYKYGSHQDKNDADLVKLTEKKLELENKIARIKGDTPSRKFLERDLENVEAEIKTTLAYRKMLEETAEAEQAAAKRREALKAGGRQLESAQGPAKAAKDRTSEFERQARLVVEGEEQAVKDITEAWQAWEKQQVKEAEETSKAVAEQWKQIFAEIDAEQERSIEDARQYMASLQDDTKEATKFARDLGLTFTSAFEDAVINGEKLSDVLQGLSKDIARIVLRKSITEPAGEAITGFLKGALGGGSFGLEQLAGPSAGGGLLDFFANLLPGFATGTDYVPHDMAAIVHKGERIIPAGENLGGGGGVVVNITNNGQPVSAEASAPRMDAGRMVVDIVLNAARTNGNFRAGLSSALAPARG